MAATQLGGFTSFTATAGRLTGIGALIMTTARLEGITISTLIDTRLGGRTVLTAISGNISTWVSGNLVGDVPAEVRSLRGARIRSKGGPSIG